MQRIIMSINTAGIRHCRHCVAHMERLSFDSIITEQIVVQHAQIALMGMSSISRRDLRSMELTRHCRTRLNPALSNDRGSETSDPRARITSLG